jgi:hypothetical protein
MLGWIVVVIALFAVCGGHEERVRRPLSQSALIKSAYVANKSSLKPHFDGFSIDDDPGAPALFDRHWSLARDWLVDYLNAHPSAREGDLEWWIGRLDSELSAHILRLDDPSFLIAIHDGEAGNVFIAHKGDEGYQVAWRIDAPAPRDLALSSLLAAWYPARAALGSCRTTTPEEAWGTCGPLSGGIGKLPDGATGERRFFVDATYAQVAGATVGGQLSIWQWNGTTARLLLANHHGYMIDQKEFMRLEGDLLRVRIKDGWRTFSSCGMCEGRQMDWTFRVGPDRVEDLGKRSVMPELDLIDDLFYRLQHRLPTKNVASPRVVKTILRFDPWIPGDTENLSAMLEQDAIVHRGNKTDVCFGTDTIPAYLFTLEPGPAGLRATGVVRRNLEENCGLKVAAGR